MKTHVSLVIALLLASASGARAQSGVTLNGVVDAAVRYTTNANASTSRKQMVPGGMSHSRLGINVVEDMGGGVTGLVGLEHRFLVDTGVTANNPAPSPADFWRLAWVGLQSKDLGQLRLGRQYNILFDLYSTSFASFRHSPYIEQYKPELGLSLASRQDNMVKYLAQVGDFYVEAQLSAGEGQANATLPNKSAGLMARYNDGIYAAGAAYLQVTEQSGKTIKALVFGASYTDGPFYLHAGWAENRFDNPFTLLTLTPGGFAASAGSASNPTAFYGAAMTRLLYTTGLVGNVLNGDANDVKTRDMLMFGATYQLTGRLNIGASVWLTRQRHWGTLQNLGPFAAAFGAAPGGYLTDAAFASKANFLAAVADYALSKRTDAYVEVDYTRMTGEVRFANGASRRGGAMLGLRHRF
ncbi:porin [Roseateles cellulosilyticus]|uniref:Porin n=1 Tax=Pelomonas cellulosilytica TaxID=2906762 RepID=A0ABS8XY43_9BURK|nr:porin [Pelomonas sp. P8]MCE4556195.1 porin [Pelomonas sp. P8]